MRTIAEKLDQTSHGLLLLTVTALGWAVPGAGYLLLGETKRFFIIFVTITLTFTIGIFAGSIGVIDPVSAGIGILGRFNPWFLAQLLNSPLVLLIGKATASGAYPVYGKPQEIGQLYTSISGLLNLLCIINGLYMAHIGPVALGRGKDAE